MPRAVRTASLAAAAMLGLLAAAVIAGDLPTNARGVALSLGAHALHVACAFAAGTTLLRLPRAKPREVGDVVLLATTLGLGLLSLLSLSFAWLGLVGAWVPWASDAVALAVGAFGRLRETVQVIRDAMVANDLAFVRASRIPVLAAIASVAVLHVVPPFLPPTPGLGAEELAVPAQTAVRSSLADALDALHERDVTPSLGLLVHGELASGHAGARLFGSTFVALLCGFVFVHARRHLGAPAAGWATLCLTTSPWLLVLSSTSCSRAIVATLAFACYHEMADWCARATGGKIATASIFGGWALAESAAGWSLFVALLAFLFVLQALIDRHGVLRQVPGLLGMAAIAIAAALPFSLLDSGLRTEVSLLEAIAAHAWPPLGAAGIPAALPSIEDPAALLEVAIAAGRSIGPLMVALLLLLPFVRGWPEGLRNVVLGAMLAGLVAVLPEPFGSPLGLPAFLAVAAGTVAPALLAAGGVRAACAAVVVSLAGPLTLLLTLNAGPNVFVGGSIMTGVTTRETYLSTMLPDAALLRAVDQRRDSIRELLVLGKVTTAHHSVPVRTWKGALPSTPERFHDVLRQMSVSHVAVGAPGTEARALVTVLQPLVRAGRSELFRVGPHPRSEATDETDSPEAPGESSDEDGRTDEPVSPREP